MNNKQNCVHNAHSLDICIFYLLQRRDGEVEGQVSHLLCT